MTRPATPSPTSTAADPPAPPRPPRTLFTLGYEKRDLAAYVALLAGAGVGVLVDVRQTAWSYKPGFSKAPLRQAVERAGIAYEHAAFAGNPKALRAAAPTHAACLAAYDRYLDAHPGVVERLDALVAEHAAAGRVACLTCFERHPGDCHRAILAARWERAAPGRRVSRHLATDGCPRLIPPTAAESPPAGAPPLVTALPADARVPRRARMTAAQAAGPSAGRGAPGAPSPAQTALW